MTSSLFFLFQNRFRFQNLLARTGLHFSLQSSWFGQQAAIFSYMMGEWWRGCCSCKALADTAYCRLKKCGITGICSRVSFGECLNIGLKNSTQFGLGKCAIRSECSLYNFMSCLNMVYAIVQYIWSHVMSNILYSIVEYYLMSYLNTF